MEYWWAEPKSARGPLKMFHEQNQVLVFSNLYPFKNGAERVVASRNRTENNVKELTGNIF